MAQLCFPETFRGLFNQFAHRPPHRSVSRLALFVFGRPFYSSGDIREVRDRFWDGIVEHFCVSGVGALFYHIYSLHDPQVTHTDFSVELVAAALHDAAAIS
jgi:hypothetical protein